jgi:hypothetical protein
MSYTKETVEEMFNGTGELYPHQKDVLTSIKFFLKMNGSFTMNEIHKFLTTYLNRPETSKYNSIVNILVKNNLLIKNENEYIPSALMKFILEG